MDANNRNVHQKKDHLLLLIIEELIDTVQNPSLATNFHPVNKAKSNLHVLIDQK